MTGVKNDSFFNYGLLLITLILLGVAGFTDGTNGGGDSIGHFLKSFYSWKHPYLFFDHWGKPLFTMLSSPFAQFGFKGIKIFNVLVTAAACFFTFKVALNRTAKNAILVLLFYFGSSSCVNITLSGLTEPLFALILILGIHLLYLDRNISAVLLLSFLPFSRSEGLIILCVIGVYLIFRKKYFMLPLLLFGHLVMGILGYGVYHDVLWVFNKIPYAKLSTIYEKGTWDHFIAHLPFDIGPIMYALLLIGLLAFTILFVKKFMEKKTDALLIKDFFLIYGIFVAFLVAHSAFHVMGIFGEMGLTRVFIGIMPIMVLMSLDGFNRIYEKIHVQRFSKIFQWLVLCSVVFYCYSNTPFSIDYKSISLTEDQKYIKETVVPEVKKNYPDFRIYLSDISLAYFLELDIYASDEKGYKLGLQKPAFAISNKELIIWDRWFSVIEEDVSKEDLLACKNLQMVADYKYSTSRNERVEFSLFTKAK